ncbi:MAG: CotH kinase family protein [Bacteroides xylanisolvens]
MNDIKFYKGESISLVFSAYDKDGKPIDISGYTKEVSLFTPFSSKLVKSVIDVSNSAFTANITGEETSNFEQEGNLNLIVKLKKGDEVKIAKSIPFVLLDPDSSGCGDTGRLSVDSGNIKIDMSFDTDFANFDVFFGNGITLIGGEDVEKYLKDYAKTETTDGKVLRTGDLANSKGASTLKAVTQKLFTDEVAKKIDGFYVKDNYLYFTSEGKQIGEPIAFASGGLVNVSNDNNTYNYATKQAARNAVLTKDRIKGQVITYQLSTGEWVLDMFVGDSVGSWGNTTNWKSYLTSADLVSVLTDIEDIKNKITVIDNRTQNIPNDFEIDEENKLYLTANGERINDGVELPSGGGGGTGSGIVLRVRIVGASSMTVGENVDALIKYNFSSVESDTGNDTGDGTYTVSVNGSNVMSGIAKQGDNTFNLKGYVFLGSNTVKIKVVDSYGNARTVTWNVQVATLTLSSTFADDTIYNTNPVPFRYTPTGIGQKTINFILNKIPLTPDVTDTSGRQITKNLTGLTNGSHSLRVYAESTIEGSALKSNELYYEFIYADASATQSIIALSYNKTEVQQFSMIDIPFMVYNPASPTANVTIRVNGQLAASLSVPRTKQNFTYQANEEGNLVITFTVGAVSKTLTINVIKSELDIHEETADLEYKALAAGKSNSSSNRDSWDYNGHIATFEGFSWANDGWQKDTSGNNCLRMIGDSKVSIDIKPFANDILITGATMTVEYSTREVTSDQAVVMTSMFAGIGVEFTPTSVTLKSAQSTLTARFNSSEKISVSLVVQKLAENRLLYLFVDGVSSGSIQYPANDNFTQSTQKPFELSTGGRACQLQVYGIRWYKNSLNFDQVLGNFIFDIENLDEKMTVYARNQLVDAFGNIDYNKALQFLPCMTFTGDLPNYKGDKKPTDIVYEDLQNPNNSFTSQGAQNDVQGTSSQFYPRKNFKFKFKNGLIYTESGEQANKYPLAGKGIPADVFCLKADFAESSGTHNTGIAVLVDQMLKEFGILVPPQQSNPKVRTTIDGFPILLFHKETASSQAQFVGKYNFNYDKAAEEVFGFVAGNECWEFKNNTSSLCLFKNANFSNWTDDLEGRYPDGGSDTTNIQKLWAWVVSCIGNPDKFKSECAGHFNIPNLLFYYVITETLVMTDQRAKNQFVTTYGERGSTNELIWRFIFYDNDTALGINNEGRIAFTPYVEDQDSVESGYVWNGWDSELWRLVKAAYSTEIKTMYQQLRQQQILSYAVTMDILQTHQALKWAELVYNQDGKYKYIDPLVDGYYDYSSGSPVLVKTGEFLYALQGSRTRHRTWYLNERFGYMDGKYDAGAHINDYVSMRLYTPTTWGGVAPDPNFKVTMAKAGYIRALYGSVKTAGQRGYTGQTYTLPAPSGVQLNDTETVIYGISAVKSLGDLSGKYVGTIDISKGYALEDIILGSTVSGYKNENLKSLSTGTNGRLKKVNVANSPNLTQSLDFSECYSLEEIEARGSGITGFSLPASGVLKKAYLPASFAAFVVKNQPYLSDVTLQGYSNVNTVVIENVPNIDGYAFVKSCINAANSKLSKVRLININSSDTSSVVLNAIAQMTGEDENGIPTDRAIITGKIHINQITQGALDRLRDTFPNLTITYTTLLNVIDFADNVIKKLMVDNYDSNGDGEISSVEVEGKSIPSGLLTDSGAKTFNEAFYWTGAGSIIDLCDTLESVGILTGHFTLNALDALKRVSLYQGPNENMTALPLLTASSFSNCYNIEEIVARGRYIENSKKGVLLGRVNGDVAYYRWILPLKGFDNIVIDEAVSIDDSYEATYPHGKLITNLTLNKLRSANVGRMLNLKKLYIKGLSESTANDITITCTNPRRLNEVYIDGSVNPGILRNIALAGDVNGTPSKITVGSGVYGGGGNFDIGSYLRISSTPQLTLEIGENYYTNIICRRGGNWSSTLSYLHRVIIRNTNPAQMSTIQWDGAGASADHFGEVFVPDELVSVYKAATNWSVIASKIKALSLWDNQ